jgi:hypothetical protein
VQGISVGSMRMFEAMNRTITANEIKPVIDKCPASTRFTPHTTT